MNKEYITIFPVRKEVEGYPTPEDTLRFTDIHIDKRFFTRDLNNFVKKADMIAFFIDNESSRYEGNSMIISSLILEFVLYSNEEVIYRSLTDFPLKYEVNHTMQIPEFVLKCKFPDLK